MHVMRSAFITGGSSGIGAALGEELARRGWQVALAARRKELLEEVATRILSSGGTAMAVPCDVTDSASVRSAVAEARGRFGSIDLAVANAGVGIPTSGDRFDLAVAEQTMKTNFFGMIYLFDAVIGEMLARGSGHFAGVASLAGHRGLPGSSMYSASKAAMQTFLEATRIELLGSGVNITTINPGFIVTAMTEKNRFKMPFLMTVDDAVTRVADGLERGRAIIEFPLPMSILTRGMRLLPHRLFAAATSQYSRRSIDRSKVRR
jgi:short-subunit dehydrogenase